MRMDSTAKVLGAEQFAFQSSAAQAYAERYPERWVTPSMRQLVTRQPRALSVVWRVIVPCVLPCGLL